MAATLTDETTHWKFTNDYDTWFVEKSTGIQMSNDYTDPWANIWAGFARKTGPNWTYHLTDEVSWTWTTDSGSGWVKLIGDTDFAGGKIAVHVEWTLEDKDEFLEVKWKMTNNFKDLDDSKMVVRNGQIVVNGATTDNWYRFYKTDDSLLDGQLPADVSYNESTDSLQPQYRLIGNSKSIHWKWDTTYSNNGTPTSTNVDVGAVNTNGKYGSNGYVYHEFNTGAWDKGTYKEVTMHWHDVETYFGASLQVFEMDGTDRNWDLSIPVQQQLDGTGSFVITRDADLDDRWAAQSFVARPVSAKKVSFRLRKWGTPNGSLSLEIYSDSGGSPNASLGTATETYASGDLTTSLTWYDFTFSSPVSLTAGTYWFVFKGSADNGDNANYFAVEMDGNGSNTVKESDNVTGHGRKLMHLRSLTSNYIQ
jgi:hypothetical protein